MRRIFFLTMLFSFLIGCGAKEVTNTKAVEEEKVSPTHMATFEVEGMMCQKGCGAAIRKGLYETGGVSAVEVTFDEKNPVNEIKVYFDIKKTSTDKIVEVIGDIADKRYSAKLKKVTESTLSGLKINEDGSTSENKI